MSTNVGPINNYDSQESEKESDEELADDAVDASIEKRRLKLAMKKRK